MKTAKSDNCRLSSLARLTVPNKKGTNDDDAGNSRGSEHCRLRYLGRAFCLQQRINRKAKSVKQHNQIAADQLKMP